MSRTGAIVGGVVSSLFLLFELCPDELAGWTDRSRPAGRWYLVVLLEETQVGRVSQFPRREYGTDYVAGITLLLMPILVHSKLTHTKTLRNVKLPKVRTLTTRNWHMLVNPHPHL